MHFFRGKKKRKKEGTRTCILPCYKDVHANPPKLYKRELLATLSAQIGHLEEHQPGTLITAIIIHM